MIPFVPPSPIMFPPWWPNAWEMVADFSHYLSKMILSHFTAELLNTPSDLWACAYFSRQISPFLISSSSTLFCLPIGKSWWDFFSNFHRKELELASWFLRQPSITLMTSFQERNLGQLHWPKKQQMRWADPTAAVRNWD